jgi:acetyl-CoA acetyltransferase
LRLQALRDLELRNAALLAKLRQFTGEMADIELDQAWHGAAAVLVMSEAKAKELGLKVLAKIVGYGTAGVAPKDLFIAPKVGIEQLLAKTGKKVSDIDLFEVNEAFAVVTMAAIHDLKLPEEKVNVNGGACALGHPIGASGARIVVTLLSALQARGFKLRASTSTTLRPCRSLRSVRRKPSASISAPLGSARSSRAA